jgi:citrate lyase subunit beta/citryl-CoA lyase
MPIIETARGLVNLERVVSSKGVVAVSYGAGDFALSVGGSAGSYLDNMAIKTFIVATAKAYGAEAIDNVFFDLDDIDGFRKQALAARGLGYTGKELVHPSQIPVANEVFSPDPLQIAWARRVVEEYDNASKKGIGAIRLDGQMVDVLQFKQAKKLLEATDQNPHRVKRASRETQGD